MLLYNFDKDVVINILSNKLIIIYAPTLMYISAYRI